MPFGKLQARFHVALPEEWLQSGHYHKDLIDGVLQRYSSGRFSHLHRETLELSQNDHQVLVTSLTKALLPRLLSLAGRPTLD